jgi:hypothetical protein
VLSEGQHASYFHSAAHVAAALFDNSFKHFASPAQPGMPSPF